MRILQLIDSLRPGGAERMAVTYANAFNDRIEASFLCCTRMEGMLRKKLVPEVGYLFLEKKNTFDIKALFKLRKYIKYHKIDLIQAHSSSFFLAVLVKLSVPGVKLVWHDHYGEDLEKRSVGILKLFSKKINGIISVNVALKKWAKENLQTRNVEYFRNFLPEPGIYGPITNKLSLNAPESFKIICLANLRPQKDHLNLLKAFRQLTGKNSGASLHLVGKDFEDHYSEGIRTCIKEYHLEERVFIYGEQQEVENLLSQANLGILSSSSEGLPVALLEYGFAGLPVVCTKVGQCEEVIGAFGKLVPPKDPEALSGAIEFYLNNKSDRINDAESFQQKVACEFSEEKVVSEVLGYFESICGK